MKKKDIKYLMLPILCIGFLSTCQSEELISAGEEEPSTTTSEEDGYLSIDLQLNTKTITRAVTDNVGIPEENYINGVRVLLYNEISSSLIGSIYYDLRYNGNDYILNSIDYNGSQPGTGILDVDKENGVISLPAVRVKKQNYRMLIFVNPNYLGYLPIGDNLTEITTPTSFLEQTRDKQRAISFGVGACLSNLYTRGENYPENYRFDNETFFLMSNADQIAGIPKEALGSKPGEAFPVFVKVERALAKVAVYNEIPNLDKLPGGASVNGETLTWACDIINMHTYLVRKPANIAPNTPGAGGYYYEHPNIDKAYTYAEDPNYHNISGQRPDKDPWGENINLDEHFFRIPEDNNDSFFHRTWITNNKDNDDINKYKFEYITENTMEAEEQYEDVTTRVVIKCQYTPNFIQLNSIEQGSNSDSDAGYFIYKGCAFTTGQFRIMKNDPTTIPVENHPEMTYFKDEVLIHEDFVNQCLNNPTESFSGYGVDYYPNGINYYSIPIRHFDNEASPDIMGHGRYGVVRNNIYRIKITDIAGPGSNKIPEPYGPDDKEEGILKATVTVQPWLQYKINFDL